MILNTERIRLRIPLCIPLQIFSFIIPFLFSADRKKPEEFMFLCSDRADFLSGHLPLNGPLLSRIRSAYMNLYILRQESRRQPPLWLPVLEWMPVGIDRNGLAFNPDPEILTWQREDGASILRRLSYGEHLSRRFLEAQSVAGRLFVLRKADQAALPAESSHLLFDDSGDESLCLRIGSRKISELSGETFLYQFILSDALLDPHLRPPFDRHTQGGKVLVDTAHGQLAFRLCDRKAILVSYCGEDEELTIPEKVEHIPVCEIGEGAFRLDMADALDDSRRHLRSVHLPEGIETIGRCAFENALCLETINLPGSLKRIEEKAFAGCSLKAIDLPDSLEEIGDFAFYMSAPAFGEYGSSQLDQLHIPASLTRMGAGAFAGVHFRHADAANGCLAAVVEDGFLLSGDRRVLIGWIGPLEEDVFIPKGIETIGVSAFEAAYEEDETGTVSVGLRRVHLGEDVRTIDSFAFYDIPTLEEVILPNSLQSVGEFAFALNAPTPVCLKMNIPAHLDEMKDYALDRRDHIRFVDFLDQERIQ